MTSYDSRPFDGAGRTSFEEELVNAMNAFANSTETPDFDAASMVRRSRRRRTTFIAAVAVALVAAGGGSALAAMSGGTTHTARPAATGVASKPATIRVVPRPATTSVAPKPTVGDAPTGHDATTVLVVEKGVKIPIGFFGLSRSAAEQRILKEGFKPGTVAETARKGCTPGTVVGVSPHSPTAVHRGVAIDLTLCSR